MDRSKKLELARALEERELRRAEQSCWHWLRKHTKTIDEQDEENPLKPFPDREYFPWVLDVMENESTVFIPKSRTMMASWFSAGFIAHKLFTKPHTTCVVQSKDEARALNVIKYIKTLWEHTTPRLRDRWPLKRPLSRQPYDRFDLENGSWALGVAGDPDRIRSAHPTIVLLDEGAFIDTEENYNVAVATRAKHIIVVSSANPGWFYEFIRDARDVKWPKYEHQPNLKAA